jgi:hypothetical protein
VAIGLILGIEFLVHVSHPAFAVAGVLALLGAALIELYEKINHKKWLEQHRGTRWQPLLLKWRGS